MLLFSTRLPLKESVTKEDIIELIREWITGSPHYGFANLEYTISDGDKVFVSGNTTVSFKTFTDSKVDVLACRLEDREDNKCWQSDCIYIDKDGTKQFLVQLQRMVDSFTPRDLPSGNKPYIVRTCMKNGYCRNDGPFAIQSEYYIVEEGYVDTAVAVMNGTADYSLPVVYLSVGENGRTVVPPNYLAKKLGGVAHVLVETDKNTSWVLRERTHENNVHNGYAGIYFPGTTDYRRHAPADYNRDGKAMADAIIADIWSMLITRSDVSDYNWTQVNSHKAKQSLQGLHGEGTQTQEQLDLYMEAFDQENKELQQQVEELSSQNYILRARLDAMTASLADSAAGEAFYCRGEEKDFYDGETNDLLYSILSQVKNRYEETSRPYTLIEDLLQANPRVGEGEKIARSIRDLFGRGCRMSSSEQARLKDLGFTVIDEGPHFKLQFHDGRYTFSIPRTPSDHREGKNTASDICKAIAIERKL